MICPKNKTICRQHFMFQNGFIFMGSICSVPFLSSKQVERFPPPDKRPLIHPCVFKVCLSCTRAQDLRSGSRRFLDFFTREGRNMFEFCCTSINKFFWQFSWEGPVLYPFPPPPVCNFKSTYNNYMDFEQHLILENFSSSRRRC